MTDGLLARILPAPLRSPVPSTSDRGREFPVNAYTTDAQYQPTAAPLPDAGFVVVWTSVWQDTSYHGAFGQRYNASTPQGEFQVNSSITGRQWYPKVAADASGSFVVIWSTLFQGGSGDGLFGQLYAPSGAPQGGEFAITVSTTSRVMQSSVARDANGDFVAVWTTDTYDVYGRRYDASGTPDGPAFPVNAHTSGFQKSPSVAFGANGTFVVVWQSPGQDGSGDGVFGRRFARDRIFGDGFEAGDMEAWSAAATDGHDLGVYDGEGLNHTFAGLRGDVNDTAGLYVQDNSPNDEGRYRARFYFATYGFDPGELQAHRRTRIFLVFEEAPLRRLVAIVLRRINGEYSLRGRAQLDDNTRHDTPFVPISDGEHCVELDWKRASGPDANDGSFELWIDGTSVDAVTTLDNSRSGVDFVRLGALSVKSGATGTLFWDEFESRRATYIGP